MTVTQPQPPLFGQTVGEAQTALKALIDSVLGEAGTDFDSWLALNLLATSGPAIPSDAFHRDLAEALHTDQAAISDLVARLRSAGLVAITSGMGADGALIELTPEGQAFHGRLREAVGSASARLLSSLDPDDVQTTIKVLREVTSRAHALPIS
jgi:MarR family transcriptional regulator, transcriptional regulator for hemolysin